MKWIMGTESFENAIFLREWLSAEPEKIEFGFFSFLSGSFLISKINLILMSNNSVSIFSL